MPGGRHKDPVWSLFERTQQGTGWKAKCKQCGLVMQGIPSRMKTHSTACLQKHSEDIIVISESTSKDAGGVAVNIAHNSSPHHERPRRAAPMDKFVVKTSKAEKETLDELVSIRKQFGKCHIPWYKQAICCQ